MAKRAAKKAPVTKKKAAKKKVVPRKLKKKVRGPNRVDVEGDWPVQAKFKLTKIGSGTEVAYEVDDEPCERRPKGKKKPPLPSNGALGYSLAFNSLRIRASDGEATYRIIGVEPDGELRCVLVEKL